MCCAGNEHGERETEVLGVLAVMKLHNKVTSEQRPDESEEVRSLVTI